MKADAISGNKCDSYLEHTWPTCCLSFFLASSCALGYVSHVHKIPFLTDYFLSGNNMTVLGFQGRAGDIILQHAGVTSLLASLKHGPNTDV